MPYVLDESSFRIDKTVFPTDDEAKQRAGEAARILGRPISVYELNAGELHFAFRVMPDGETDEEQPTVDPQPGDTIEPSAPAVLGRTRHAIMFDSVAQVLEDAGRPDLAAAIDRYTTLPRR